MRYYSCPASICICTDANMHSSCALVFKQSIFSAFTKEIPHFLFALYHTSVYLLHSFIFLISYYCLGFYYCFCMSHQIQYFIFPFDSLLNFPLGKQTMKKNVILQNLISQAISITELFKLNVSGPSGKSQSNTILYLLNNIVSSDLIFLQHLLNAIPQIFPCFIRKIWERENHKRKTCL